MRYDEPRLVWTSLPIGKPVCEGEILKSRL